MLLDLIIVSLDRRISNVESVLLPSNALNCNQSENGRGSEWQR